MCIRKRPEPPRCKSCGSPPPVYDEPETLVAETPLVAYEWEDDGLLLDAILNKGRGRST